MPPAPFSYPSEVGSLCSPIIVSEETSIDGNSEQTEIWSNGSTSTTEIRAVLGGDYNSKHSHCR